MGTLITARQLSLQNQSELLKPIVYCCAYESVTEKAVPINIELSQVLKAFKPNRRTMQIERCFADILARLQEGVVLKDFDVLFNPEYNVDVLKIIVNACKAKPFSVIWPGYYQGVFLLMNYTYEDDKDEAGNVRKEYKFRLRKQLLEE